MRFFVHKRIKRFFIEGTIADNNLASSVRETYLSVLRDQMKNEGYAELLDLDNDFTVQYNGTTYNCLLSIYGTFVGKKQASCLEGIYGSRGIYTAPIKSEALSAL